MEGGYACEFVEKPPLIFECQVCKLYLRQPHFLECCGKNACLVCVDDAKQKGGPCPLCNCRHLKTRPSRELGTNLLERNVYCNFKKDGCQWVGKLENLSNHCDAECGYVLVTCVYGCGEQMVKMKVKSHEMTCSHYPTQCECGETVTRQALARHNIECPLAVVSCPFSIAGCSYTIRNKDLQPHLEALLGYHAILVSRQSNDLKEQVKRMKEDHRVDDEQDHQLQQLSNETAILSKRIAAAKAKKEKLELELEAAEEELMSLENGDRPVVREFTKLVSSNDQDIDTLTNKVDRLKLQLKTKCYGPSLPRPTCVVSRPEPPLQRRLVPPVGFTIERFLEKKTDGVMIVTPPFYSHVNGYKMCLKVYCNGFKTGYGQWLSVFVCIAKGDYDDFLTWPFRGSVTVRVENILKMPSNNYGLKVHTIVMDSVTNPSCAPALSRVVGEDHINSQMVGIEKLIHFSQLQVGGKKLDQSFTKPIPEQIDKLQINVMNVQVVFV